MKQMNLGSPSTPPEYTKMVGLSELARVRASKPWEPPAGSHRPIKTTGVDADTHPHITVICMKGTEQLKEGLCYAVTEYTKGGQVMLARDGKQYGIDEVAFLDCFEVCHGYRVKDTVFKDAYVYSFRDGKGYKENDAFQVVAVGSVCQLENRVTGETVSVKMNDILKDFF